MTMSREIEVYFNFQQIVCVLWLSFCHEKFHINLVNKKVMFASFLLCCTVSSYAAVFLCVSVIYRHIILRIFFSFVAPCSVYS